MNKVSIIVPVYDGLEETTACLESLYRTKKLNSTPFEIVVINDSSPNPDLVEFLESYANREGVSYLVNERNKGFVGTVNRGMSETGSDDVVLLNSDTEVANNWVDRLMAAAYRADDIGSVTPYSNNAEICSFPAFVKVNQLPYDISVDTLDALFSKVNIEELIDIPTAVGFCMYIKRSCIAKTGLFDEETFGRGYGEENDFCMRSQQRGFRHVLCQNVFVYHAGGVSFGPEKMKRVQRAMDTLDRLYPDYHEMVHQFIQMDPSRFARALLYVEFIKKCLGSRQKILAITHNMGGGTERHIKELAEYLKKRAVFLVLRAGQNGKVGLSLGHDETAPCIPLTMPDDYPFLLNICEYLDVARVHCHHIMGVDPSIWGVLGDLGIPLDVTLHDYYFINGNPTLTNPDGDFCEDKLTRDSYCEKRYPIPGHASPEFWRYNQYNFLKQAARIFSPSLYTAKIYKEYFPELSILPVYHPDWEQFPQYPPVSWPEIQAGQPLRIVIIGAISKEKGADILDATARLATRGEPFKFHLIGYAYRPLEPSIEETGPYKESELDDLLREINPHIVWFPCRWAETYSYTLSAALKAGLPIVAPDLGSFPERLNGREFSWIVPWKTDPGGYIDLFTGILSKLQNSKINAKHTPLVTAPSAFRYASNYLLPGPIKITESSLDVQNLRKHMTTSFSANQFLDIHRPLTESEKILVWFLKIRSKPVVYKILRILPFNAMQSFKRTLSERPIHEILARYQSQGGDLSFVRTVLPGIFRIVFRAQKN